MTAEEALQYEKDGGKLYEPMTFDPKLIIPKEEVVVYHLPATNPFPEDGK